MFVAASAATGRPAAAAGRPASSATAPEGSLGRGWPGTLEILGPDLSPVTHLALPVQAVHHFGMLNRTEGAPLPVGSLLPLTL